MEKRCLFLIIRNICLCILYINSIYGQPKKLNVDFKSYPGWNAVFEKAKAEDKYVFVDVIATWCEPCRMMDKNVFSNDSVAELFNSKFISIKIQIDTTKADKPLVKLWYSDAAKFRVNYSIESIPTFLLFSNTGNLLIKATGYHTPSQIIAKVKLAIIHDSSNLVRQLENYKAGDTVSNNLYQLAYFAYSIGDKVLAKRIAKSYLSMNVGSDSLVDISKINFVYDIAKDYLLAEKLVIDYKSRFLKSSQTEMYDTRTLDFINKYFRFFYPKDSAFSFLMHHLGYVDSVCSTKGWGASLCEKIVERSEVSLKYLGKDKETTNQIDWDSLKLNLTSKYPMLDLNTLILKNQVRYYRLKKDWRSWARYKNLTINKIVDSGNLFLIINELNDDGAWDVFLNCKDQAVMSNALIWINLAIILNSKNPGLYDSKANLLYKMGFREEAIKLEEKAVAIKKDLLAKKPNRYLENSPYELVLSLMLQGKQTYLEEGAVW